MYDTIIIGAGIAGCTAAIYASRKKLNYLFLTDIFGGQFMESGEILNYPGIIKTTGADFAAIMKKQLDFNKVKVSEGEKVTKIKKNKTGFKVITGKGEYESYTVIITTGARARQLNVPGEKELSNKGLTYCSICDGPLFQGMDVAVIGGGNSAAEGAYFMKDIAKKIYLIVIGDKLTAHEYLQENLNKAENIEIIYNAKTKEILGDKMVSGLRYEQDRQEKELKVKGIIVEIGRVPNSGCAKGAAELDELGHIKVNNWCCTSTEGLFAAGDCTDVKEYQYVIAAGQACTTLLKAARYLSRIRKKS